MNVSSYTNWNLIKYSLATGSLILVNYFLLSINIWQIFKYINFIFFIVIIFYFFISKKFNEYWYLKIIILFLFIISLGSPTLSIDSRYIYLFSAKIFFYESNIYSFLNNHLSEIATTRPKLPATLSATFAQLIGFWNEVFPKSSNIIVILPPIIFLVSFFKNKIFIILWLFIMLFFSGKLFINGSLDGIISLYFVSCILISYKLLIIKKIDEQNILYSLLFLFFSILSLTKNEGSVMVLMIFFTNILINFLYYKKINFKFIFITLISLVPFFMWKYIVIINSLDFTIFEYETGNPINRFLDRISNSDDLLLILSYLVENNKLILSAIFFILVSYKFFTNNKKLIFFISINFLLYFLAIIFAFLIDPFDLTFKLQASSTRVFIPLVLMLSYFSIFIIKNKYFLEQNKTHTDSLI